MSANSPAVYYGGAKQNWFLIPSCPVEIKLHDDAAFTIFPPYPLAHQTEKCVNETFFCLTFSHVLVLTKMLAALLTEKPTSETSAAVFS